MENEEAAKDSVQSGKCRDTRVFDRLMLIYFLGVIAVSFYAVFSFT
ncbi:MAG: hypothetical protein JET69_04905 [Methanomassiliicoccales archaeon]|nr:hypothetical protein [Methanomassiliicoccales archaeon]